MNPTQLRVTKQHLPIILLILLNLLIGIMVVRDYGESTDEPGMNTYTEVSLQAYPYLFQTGKLISFENINDSTAKTIGQNSSEFYPPQLLDFLI